MKSVRSNLKTYLAILWAVFTVGMITWWWIYGLRLSHEAVSVDPNMAKGYRMLLWEGGSLLLTVTLGGIALIVYVYRDSKRTERLRLFFSGFSHDIKTSIARLRLQSDVLMEESEFQNHPVLKRLVQDIGRLELQLENSLMLASPSDSKLFFEEVSFGEVLSRVRSDFPELEFQLEKDIKLNVDKRAMFSVLRNLFHNSIRHGEATKIVISVEADKNNQVIVIKDNGKGSQINIVELLQQNTIVPMNGKSGSGMGMALSKSLIERMGGKFQQLIGKPEQVGFAVRIELPKVHA